MGEWVGLLGATISVCLGGEGGPGFQVVLDLVAGACLELTVIFGFDLGVLPFSLVVVTSLRVGLSVTGVERVWDWVECQP
jgi:hypothetical protein